MTEVHSDFTSSNGDYAELYYEAFSPDSSSIQIKAEANGYIDAAIVSRVDDGEAGETGSSVTAYLTQPSYTVKAYADGSVDSWANSVGIFKVYNDKLEVTNEATFSVLVESEATGSIDTIGVVRGEYAGNIGVLATTEGKVLFGAE